MILDYNDISWNIDTENNSLASKLCFSSDSRHCSHKEFALTVFVDEEHLNKVEKLQFLARQSGSVYISYKRPTISDVNNFFKCSPSTKIYINDSVDKKNHQCLQFKFLSFNNELVERKCINFQENKVIQKLDVLCNNVQNLNKLVFYNENDILNKTYLAFTFGLTKDFCCSNRTHFIEYIGQCSKFITNYLENLTNFKLKYRTPDCPVLGYRKYALFLKTSEQCIIVISVHAKCKQNFEAVNCDLGQYSCDMIMKK